MVSYRNLLLEPQGHRRVIFVAIDGTEGVSEAAALHDALEEVMNDLAAQRPGLPFAALVHLRKGALPGESAAERVAQRSRLYLSCVRQLAARGLAFLACMSEDEAGRPSFAGTRFSSGGFEGGYFRSLDDAYRWLDTRLSAGRSRTPLGG